MPLIVDEPVKKSLEKTKFIHPFIEMQSNQHFEKSRGRIRNNSLCLFLSRIYGDVGL